jgi:hypothetical protein
VVIEQLHNHQTHADGIPRLVTIAGLLHHPSKLTKVYLTVTCGGPETMLNCLVLQQDEVQIYDVLLELSANREKKGLPF